MKQNSLKFITVYRYNGFWVFDEPSVSLVKEPFVAGADTLIDILAKDKEKVAFIFTEHKFPGYNLSLIKTNEEVDGTTGTDYTCPEYDNHKLWLCPALLKFFNEPPKEIFVKYNLI